MVEFSEKQFRLIYMISLNRMNEISVTTFADKIRRAIASNNVIEAGSSFGRKFAKNPFDNTIQCRSMVIEGVSAERFNRQNFDYNTKLIETLFNDLQREIPDTDSIKDYLEAFVRELRNVGGTFTPSELLAVA